jgi:hypothetical protein
VEIEAIADAWYIWVAVGAVSVTTAGLALGLPTAPPPDASGAANAADRAAMSQSGTSVSYGHGAEEVRLGTRQIALRNDAGTDHASVRFRPLTPITAAEGKLHSALEAMLAGADPGVVAAESGYGREAHLREALADLRARVDRSGAEWQRADGELRIRSVRIAGERVVLIGA